MSPRRRFGALLEVLTVNKFNGRLQRLERSLDGGDGRFDPLAMSAESQALNRWLQAHGFESATEALSAGARGPDGLCLCTLEVAAAAEQQVNAYRAERLQESISAAGQRGADVAGMEAELAHRHTLASAGWCRRGGSGEAKGAGCDVMKGRRIAESARVSRG